MEAVRRFGCLLLAAGLTLTLCGCLRHDSILARLPDYESVELERCSGFLDAIEYGKYTYSGVTAWNLQLTGYFEPVTPENLDTISMIAEDFKSWANTCGMDAFYDFSSDIAAEGDYCFIEYSTFRDGSFSDYTLYYFCLESQILYYIHCNR